MGNANVGKCGEERVNEGNDGSRNAEIGKCRKEGVNEGK